MTRNFRLEITFNKMIGKYFRNIDQQFFMQYSTILVIFDRRLAISDI